MSVPPSEDSSVDNLPALIYAFDDSQIRAEVIDGEPWFCAADVCSALEIVNTSQAVGRLDQLDICTTEARSQYGNRLMLFVNESGLYGLIFDSRKPEARRFQRWITSEVIPSIRKTGSYQVKPAQPHSSQRALPSDTRLQPPMQHGPHTMYGYDPVSNEVVPLYTALEWLREIKQIDPSGRFCRQLHYKARAAARAQNLRSSTLASSGNAYVHKWPDWLWQSAYDRLIIR